MSACPGSADVLVLGAGPSGVAAAIALRRHAPHLHVVLAEGASRPRSAPRHETLSPAGRRVAESLGILDASANRHLCWGHTGGLGGGASPDHDFVLSPQGPGEHVDRDDLDERLRRAALASGVELIRDLTFAGGADPGGSEARAGRGVRFKDGSVVCARFVVDATGQAACFARSRGARRISFDRLVAVVAWAPHEDGSTTPHDRISVESAPQGVWVSALTPSGLAVLLLTDGDIARDEGLAERDTFLAGLSATERTVTRMGDLSRLRGPFLRPARSAALTEPAGEDWIAVGDAAFSMDPLSGQGMTKALVHGVWAGYTAADVLAGRPHAITRYRGRVRAEVEAYLTARTQVYAEEHRFRTSPFWRRRSTGLHTIH